MKHYAILLVIVLTMTSCGSAPAPLPTPDIQGTISAMSDAMVAATLTAQPSPTSIPTRTSLPTATFLPTATTALTVTPTLDPLAGGPTATPWSGTLSPGNTQGLPVGFLQIINNTGVKEITVTLNGITLTREQPVYYAYIVTRTLNLTIFWARYQYVVQIPNKRILTGSFMQNSKDKTTMRVDLTKVAIMGP